MAVMRNIETRNDHTPPSWCIRIEPDTPTIAQNPQLTVANGHPAMRDGRL